MYMYIKRKRKKRASWIYIYIVEGNAKRCRWRWRRRIGTGVFGQKWRDLMPIWLFSSHLRKVCNTFSLRLFAFFENGDQLFYRAVCRDRFPACFLPEEDSCTSPLWPPKAAMWFDSSKKIFFNFIFIMIKKIFDGENFTKCNLGLMWIIWSQKRKILCFFSYRMIKNDRFYVGINVNYHKFLRSLNFLGLVKKILKWNFKMELLLGTPRTTSPRLYNNFFASRMKQ